MKKRWAVYILVGVLFGVIDFYYQEHTSGFATSTAMWFVVAWGIWLVPAIPVVIYESKVSGSRSMSALANVLTWGVSVISYYLYMFFKLVFIGQASMQFLHISNRHEPNYLSNIKSIFWGDVKDGIFEWIGIAVIGGFITGGLISHIYLKLRKTAASKLDSI